MYFRCFRCCPPAASGDSTPELASSVATSWKSCPRANLGCQELSRRNRVIAVTAATATTARRRNARRERVRARSTSPRSKLKMSASRSIASSSSALAARSRTRRASTVRKAVSDLIQRTVSSELRADGCRKRNGEEVNSTKLANKERSTNG